MIFRAGDGGSAGTHPSGELLSCSSSQIEMKKKDFVYTVISNVLLDLPFSRNLTVKLTEDRFIRILENKIKNL